MKAVLFAYYLNSKHDSRAPFIKEQCLDFMRSYKVRKWRKSCVI